MSEHVYSKMYDWLQLCYKLSYSFSKLDQFKPAKKILDSDEIV